ncbi:sensor domain-containing diguanylate cyclase [Bacillota bacterium LX-D]|nr:sensor domain-containing diguanylate cyclase [Bacillota bacterium LX-D]
MVTKKIASKELRDSLIIANTLDYILTIDPKGNIDSINPAALKFFGYDEVNIIKKNINLIIPEIRSWDLFIKCCLQSSDGNNVFELVGKNREGNAVPLEVSFSKMRLGNNNFYIAIMRDITHKKMYEEKLRFFAHHDPLTGLPNRLYFNENVCQELYQLGRCKKTMAVMFLDLDNFKNINDTMGHDVGDSLLKEIAGRLKNVLRRKDIIARYGGDEFVIFLPDIYNQAAAARVARKIIRTVSQNYKLKNSKIYITVSIGISIYPLDGENLETLLKNADLALYRAKKMGKNNFQFYKATKQF